LASLNRHLDESDVEAVILRHQDDSLLADFSTRRCAREGVIEGAKEDQEVQ
jgi:hypothetical protein